MLHEHFCEDCKTYFQCTCPGSDVPDCPECHRRDKDRISTLEAALREIAEHPHYSMAGIEIKDRGFYDPYDEPSTRCGHAEGHRCAAEIARKALEKK